MARLGTSRSLARSRSRSRGHRPGSRPWLNLLYALPALAMIALFFYGAIIFAAQSSLQEWNFISPPKPVGLGNYEEVVSDKIFIKSVANTFVLVGLSLVIQAALGFILAVMVTAPLKFARSYKTLFFIPVVLSPGILAWVFRRMFDPGGEMSTFIDEIGLGFLWQPWLADPRTALFAVTGMVIWSSLGFSFLLYSAGMTQLDKEIVEAARIDGANTRQLIRHVILPLLKSTHVTLLILGIAAAVSTFDMVIIATDGGPARATEVIATYLFKKTIIEFQGGYASAISILVMAGALAMTILVLFLVREKPSKGAA
jgi:raffinose/stachyose/melibiose transport system permease protein